jgi:hypothetical protein
MKSLFFRITLPVLLTLLFPFRLRADVQITEEYQNSGFMGIGASRGETIQKIKGNDSSIDSSQDFSGGMMGLIGDTQSGPKRKIDIIRLQDKKRWILDPVKKTYTEVPLKAKTPKEPNMSHIPVRLKGTSFKIAPSKMRKTIHGFKTRLYNAEFIMKLENTKNKQVSTFKVKLKIWVAPWTLTLKKAHREIEDFNLKYLKATGTGSVGLGAQPLGLEMLKSMTHSSGTELTKGITEFRKKMSEIPGFPIEMESNWYVSLPKQKSQSPAALEGLKSANLPAATKNLLAGLLEAANPNGESPLISMTSSVSSIKLAPLAEKNFQIPQGYRRK